MNERCRKCREIHTCLKAYRDTEEQIEKDGCFKLGYYVTGPHSILETAVERPYQRDNEVYSSGRRHMI